MLRAHSFLQQAPASTWLHVVTNRLPLAFRNALQRAFRALAEADPTPGLNPEEVNAVTAGRCQTDRAHGGRRARCRPDLDGSRRSGGDCKSILSNRLQANTCSQLANPARWLLGPRRPLREARSTGVLRRD